MECMESLTHELRVGDKLCPQFRQIVHAAGCIIELNLSSGLALCSSIRAIQAQLRRIF